MREVDLLVVGLGPAGAAAARAAATAGLSVLGIDKKKRLGEPVQCAEFVPLPMGKYARADGVLVQRIEAMKSVLPSGAVTRSGFPGLMIDRVRFDCALAEAARAAGASIAPATRLLDIDTGAKVARVEGALDASHVSYRFLIAADGPHSPVARRLGLPDLPVVHTRQYTVALRRPYADTDIWLSDAFPGGYAWLFPKGALANLGLGADRRFEPDMKAPLDRLHAQLVAQGLVGREIHARTGGAIPVGGLRSALTHGDALFAGDAAGLTHPITGAGIAAAVVSGEAAGAAVARALQGDASALASYEEDMRDQFEETIARACRRRRELDAVWRRPAANEDATQRRGWIAFNEYFENL